MSDDRRVKKHYSAVFDQLNYQNKGMLNDVSGYLKRKKLNRLTRQQIAADIADMVLDNQNKDVPIDELFGGNRDAFCDRLSEKALPASSSEKLLAGVRNIAAVAMLVSIIVVIEIMASFETIIWGWLVLALAFVVIFIAVSAGEIYVVRRNYSQNCITSEKYKYYH